jgi:signal transduction histidine kinase
LSKNHFVWFSSSIDSAGGIMTSDVALTPSFGERLGERIRQEGRALSARWLAELMALLPVDAHAIFPTDALLDHVPELVDQIGHYVASPASGEIAANTLVAAKAREFGQLRHSQQASVHQLLREYEILGRVLESFVIEETERLGLTPSPRTCLELSQRIHRAVYALMQTTVDTFVAEYVAAVEDHAEKLRTFNQMLSHELRNPLNTLQFAADLLARRGEGDESSQRLLQLIVRNVHHAASVTRSLARLGQVESSTSSASEQHVEVDAVAREVVRQLADSAEVRGVTLRITDSLPSLVLDAGKLELVLINLVSNAIKYRDPRKAERFVEIEADFTDSELVLNVRDNGLGIAPEDQAAIFERSHRAHMHLDDELGNDGFGMGLTIVQECVRELNGRIELHSRPGEGTQFVVRLPIPPTNDTATPLS